MSAWSRWSLDPAVLAGVAAACYGRGLRRLWRAGRGRGVSTRRAAAFFGGLVTLLVALASPLDGAAESLLSAHMVQHLLLLTVAPPLLILGRPLLVGLQGVSPEVRRDAQRLGHRPWIRATVRRLTNPVFAWILQAAVVWAWHAPRAYQAALSSPWVHSFEHASFLAAAMAFWWPVLEPGVNRRLPRGADVLYLLTAWLQSGALGALFAFSTAPVYPVYAARAAVLGSSALADQQLAGLLMWIPGGFVTLGAAGALFVEWLKAEERSMQRLEARAAAPPRVGTEVER